ncbi:hypothetical protein EF888_08125 [Silicimonas algicola]|uniref:Uncharacterized protein n=1 Tax=Silicimonas algicola TaxID=1826607 RepID=A0A316G3J3_9RHOB|nr:hypothetical protein EF888_08125 [Silicimonas algicola]PWK55368.1 hypothetical protein C8D95_10733 [Silicimonas algicola]
MRVVRVHGTDVPELQVQALPGFSRRTAHEKIAQGKNDHFRTGIALLELRQRLKLAWINAGLFGGDRPGHAEKRHEHQHENRVAALSNEGSKRRNSAFSHARFLRQSRLKTLAQVAGCE